jgi:hypothetical protein
VTGIRSGFSLKKLLHFPSRDIKIQRIVYSFLGGLN